MQNKAFHSPIPGHQKLVVVIPAYNAADTISGVLNGIPHYVQDIVVVNDYSEDETEQLVLKLQVGNNRIRPVTCPMNLGVGGAMMIGYEKALELGADIVIKMDSDGQMDPGYIPDLVMPIVKHTADYTKGNRFLHFQALTKMPFIRRIGNIGLSFLTKFASGYWNIFDPTNGFTAIHSDILKKLDYGQIHKRFFFEISMLIQLGLNRAVVQDVSIPAKYGNEKSNLSETKSLLQFPVPLLFGFIKRILIQYYVRDFTAVSIFTLFGLVHTIFGFCFGLFHWIKSINTGIPATTGTVMVAVLPFIIGSQLIIQAMVMDINNTPKICISKSNYHQD